MQKYIKYAVKDCSPEKTIKKIKQILTSIGIKIKETRQFNGIQGCYSLGIEVNSIPHIRTYGKGITISLARASAYGELMERLQNNILFNTSYGLKNEVTLIDKNSFELNNINNILLKYKKIFKYLTNVSTKTILNLFKNEQIICEKYYNIQKDCFEYLPSDFINILSGSTGMCAGNTYPEAIIQGICEIFERYATKIIHKSSANVPNILIENIQDTVLFKIITNIQKKGYLIKIKDCTLGGKFPVVGVVLTHPKTNNYCVRFGSHPVFNIALQRCLTEIFQGIKTSKPQDLLRTKGFLNLNSDSKKVIEKERWKQNRNGTGKFTYSFINFSSKKNFKYKVAFIENYNNQKLLIFLLRLLEKNNLSIYIRSFSYLNFPTFKIYIPEMSNNKKLTINDLNVIKYNRLVRKYLLNLNQNNKQEIKKCAKILDTYLNSVIISVDKNILISQICKIFFNKKSDFIYLCNNYYYLLAILYFRSKEFFKASLFFDLHVKEVGSLLDKESKIYFKYLSKALKLKSKKFNLSEIKKKVLQSFNKKLCLEAINDANAPEKVLEDFILPECSGKCCHCPTQKVCYYPYWKNIGVCIEHEIKKNSPLFNIKYYRNIFNNL